MPKPRDLKRYSHIGSVLARHGFHEFVDRLKAHYHGVPHRRFTWKRNKLGVPSAPRRIRLVFEELGPTFIKFAQVLSSRPQ